MNRMSRTEARPPRTARLPWCLPESSRQRRHSGQLGDGLVGQRADLRHLGHDAGHGAIGHALDGAERLIQFAPQRVGLAISVAMRCSRSRIWPATKASSLVNEACTAAIGDQALLVQLRGADLGELTQTRDQGAQLLLAFRSQAQGRDLLHLGIPGDHAGIDGDRSFPAGPCSAANWRTARGLSMATAQAGFATAAQRPAARSRRWLPWPPVRPGARGRRQPARRCLPRGWRNDAAAPSRPMRACRESVEATSTPQMIRVTVTCLVCSIEDHATVRSYVTWAAVPGLSDGRDDRRMNGSRPPAGEPIPRFPHCNSLYLNSCRSFRDTRMTSVNATWKNLHTPASVVSHK